jgi:feruloyl esterase
VFGNPDWDFRSFSFATDQETARRKVGSLLDATSPTLDAFARRDGRLILYHGFSDPVISPLNSIDYFERVVSARGGREPHEQALRDTAAFVRLFMVPGMQHCGGGPGPTGSTWSAPSNNGRNRAWRRRVSWRLTRRTVIRFTRPLCPYPQVATYTGVGGSDDGAHFVCAAAP